jgi:hypothetical protein
VAEARAARYLHVSKEEVAVKQADLRSTLEVLPQAQTTNRLPARLGDRAVVWQVYQTVQRVEDQQVVSAYATELALDRRTGAATPWDEQWLDDSAARKEDGTVADPAAVAVAYEGQVYKFPFGAGKRSYPVFDRDLRRALPAAYSGTERVKGVDAYRYQQVINEESLTVKPDSLKLLLRTFAPGATDGKVLYSNTRTLWVEPVTGQYLRVREQQRKELVAGDGTRTVLLDADFVVTEATVAQTAKAAGGNAFKIQALRRYAPLALGALALVAMAGGLLLALRGRRADTGQYTVPLDG